jgi:hypothetical protein
VQQRLSARQPRISLEIAPAHVGPQPDDPIGTDDNIAQPGQPAQIDRGPLLGGNLKKISRTRMRRCSPATGASPAKPPRLSKSWLRRVQEQQTTGRLRAARWSKSWLAGLGQLEEAPIEVAEVEFGAQIEVEGAKIEERGPRTTRIRSRSTSCTTISCVFTRACE